MKFTDCISDVRSHIDAARFVLTIQLFLLSWSERWMTIFGSSGEFQLVFFYHLASWKVDVCVIAFLNTAVGVSPLFPPPPPPRLGEVGFSSLLFFLTDPTARLDQPGSNGSFRVIGEIHGKRQIWSLDQSPVIFFTFVVLNAKSLVSFFRIHVGSYVSIFVIVFCFIFHTKELMKMS